MLLQSLLLFSLGLGLFCFGVRRLRKDKDIGSFLGFGFLGVGLMLVAARQ